MENQAKPHSVAQYETCLVIPTIRENSFRQFIELWKPLGLFGRVRLVVMEDNPRKTFNLFELLNEVDDGTHIHLCWEDIDNMLGENAWIIPRRSDTVRSFAYYFSAVHLKPRYIITLDDDCYPPRYESDGVEYTSAHEFISMHIDALEDKSKGRWFNTLPGEVKPRGIPYKNVGSHDVALNHGLWTNVPDYDAPTQLVNPAQVVLFGDSQIVPVNQYFPMCGMNVAWKTEYTPLMYHMLMGQMRVEEGPVDPNSNYAYPLQKLPFDRFGDIWCGIVAKRALDVLGKSVSTGTPYIRHERASNPFVNLKKEANGIGVNEDFWEFVDSIRLSQTTYGHNVEAKCANIYWKIGTEMSLFPDKYPVHEEYRAYFTKLRQAMMIWSDLFV